MKNSFFSTKQITKISILAIISAILLLFNFPLVFFPSFYKIDFADVPRLLCGFAISPIAGLICTVISLIIKIIIQGSETGFVGELAVFIISASYVLPASIIYKKNHTKRGAIISLIVGSIFLSIVSVFANYFILIPLYNIPIESIIKVASEYIPFIHSKLSLVMFCTLPFNLIKTIINSLIIILIYKRISPLLKDNSL